MNLIEEDLKHIERLFRREFGKIFKGLSIFTVLAVLVGVGYSYCVSAKKVQEDATKALAFFTDIVNTQLLAYKQVIENTASSILEHNRLDDPSSLPLFLQAQHTLLQQEKSHNKSTIILDWEECNPRKYIANIYGIRQISSGLCKNNNRSDFLHNITKLPEDYRASGGLLNLCKLVKYKRNFIDLSGYLCLKTPVQDLLYTGKFNNDFITSVKLTERNIKTSRSENHDKNFIEHTNGLILLNHDIFIIGEVKSQGFYQEFIRSVMNVLSLLGMVVACVFIMFLLLSRTMFFKARALEKYLHLVQKNEAQERELVKETNLRSQTVIKEAYESLLTLTIIGQDKKIEMLPMHKDQLLLKIQQNIKSLMIGLPYVELSDVFIHESVNKAINLVSKKAFMKNVSIKYGTRKVYRIKVDEPCLLSILSSVICRFVLNLQKNGSINITASENEGSSGRRLIIMIEDNGYCIGEDNYAEGRASLDTKQIKDIVALMGWEASWGRETYQGNNFMLSVPYEINAININSNKKIIG